MSHLQCLQGENVLKECIWKIPAVPPEGNGHTWVQGEGTGKLGTVLQTGRKRRRSSTKKGRGRNEREKEYQCGPEHHWGRLTKILVQDFSGWQSGAGRELSEVPSTMGPALPGMEFGQPLYHSTKQHSDEMTSAGCWWIVYHLHTRFSLVPICITWIYSNIPWECAGGLVRFYVVFFWEGRLPCVNKKKCPGSYCKSYAVNSSRKI